MDRRFFDHSELAPFLFMAWVAYASLPECHLAECFLAYSASLSSAKRAI
jgi:hypothetical protein